MSRTRSTTSENAAARSARRESHSAVKARRARNSSATSLLSLRNVSFSWRWQDWDHTSARHRSGVKHTWRQSSARESRIKLPRPPFRLRKIVRGLSKMGRPHSPVSCAVASNPRQVAASTQHCNCMVHWRPCKTQNWNSGDPRNNSTHRPQRCKACESHHSHRNQLGIGCIGSACSIRNCRRVGEGVKSVATTRTACHTFFFHPREEPMNELVRSYRSEHIKISSFELGHDHAPC
jgi:hypothetical protein